MTILADTSIWIDHFRKNRALLPEWLAKGRILMHPCVYGELSCGSMSQRSQILSDLSKLPHAKVALDYEVLQLLETRKLWSRGLGWIEVHLLASAQLSKASLWTLDKRLIKAATELGIQLRLS